MADFFKSAFGYLGNSGVSQDNDFVGQYVELGDQKLRVRKVIAEGKLSTDLLIVNMTHVSSLTMKLTLFSERVIHQTPCFG